MSTYLYKCKNCGHREEHTALLADRNECPIVNCSVGKLVRDWKAEAVGFKTVPGGYKEASRRG